MDRRQTPALAIGTAPAWPSIAALAELVRERTVSAGEVVRECLDRIGRLDPQLNAFVTVLADSALAAATESEARVLRGEGGLLEGVPVAVKDNTQVQGCPMTRGSWSSGWGPAAEDAEVVARLRRAGAIIVGTTNLPEFGAIPVTESDRLGPCRNPWRLDLTPGGSSGGSAAAVAAGMVPVAQGNDGGGSLRIPASCCGLIGLKPSRGRISLSPGPGDATAGLVTQGFLSSRSADTALLLDVASGPAPGDPYHAPRPRIPFSAAVAGAGPRLRVGWTTKPPVEAEVTPACRSAVAAAAAYLEELGHEVREIDPGWTRDWLAPEFRKLWAAGMHANLLALEPGRAGGPRVEGHVRALAEQGATLSAADLLLAQARLQMHTRDVARLWLDVDVVMTPTLARPPLQIGELFRGGAADPMGVMEAADRFTPFTPFFNVSGQPAISVPLHQERGVPIGVQLAGRLYEEAALLEIAQELELLTGWPQRRPPVAGASFSSFS